MHNEDGHRWQSNCFVQAKIVEGFFEPRKPAQIWYLGQAESSRKVGKKIGQKEGVETTLKRAFCAVY